MATGRDPVIMSLHLLRMAISIPSLLLYCVQLNAIRRCPKLHTSFFKLFALRAIIGMFYEARYFIGSVLPFFGLFFDLYVAMPKWVLKTNLYNLYMFYMDDVTTAFILLNRMIALAIPLRQKENIFIRLFHPKIWRRAFPVSVIATFLVPGSLCTYLFSEQAVLVVIPEEDGNGTTRHVMSYSFTFTYQLGPNDEQPSQRMARETIVFGIVFILLCLLINLFTFVAYRKYYKNLTVSRGENVAEVTKERRTEVKITIYAVATFFSHTLVILMQIIIYALLKAGYTASVLRIQYLNGILYIFCAVTLPAALMHWSSAEIHQRTVNTVKWALLLPKKWLEYVFTCTNSVSTELPQQQHNTHNSNLIMRRSNQQWAMQLQQPAGGRLPNVETTA